MGSTHLPSRGVPTPSFDDALLANTPCDESDTIKPWASSPASCSPRFRFCFLAFRLIHAN
ncbi:hypothetical protein BDR04DRAFT_1101817 [Suillus decipiens]|nr:hypothetical protein BDR04DRAFT_1101817 [Suillus decipiens]